MHRLILETNDPEIFQMLCELLEDQAKQAEADDKADGGDTSAWIAECRRVAAQFERDICWLEWGEFEPVEGMWVAVMRADIPNKYVEVRQLEQGYGSDWVWQIGMRVYYASSDAGKFRFCPLAVPEIPKAGANHER